MPLDLPTMRTLFRKPLGIDSDDMDDPDVDLYLNRSYWEIMDKFPFREKERAGQFPTTAGIRNYAIPTPVEAVKGFAVVNPTTKQHIPLDQMKGRETEYRYNENTFDQGIPQRYLLENCYVRFWPTPDTVYTIVIRKHTILADIADSGIEIPQIWGEVVIYGGVWRAFFDYGDVPKMQATMNLQHQMISTITPREIKEIVDHQYASLEPAISREIF